MPKSLPTRPAYAESFHCIGSACEDTCCQGWTVPIDQASYERYQSLPDGPMRTRINDVLLRSPEGTRPALFAKIQMDGENQCPLFTADRLCGIQAELGEQYLSFSCASYPRIHQNLGGRQETALTLSCPEAARLVLLTPGLLAKGNLETEETAADAPPVAGLTAIQRNSGPIRKAVLSLVVNRAYPLWQRLFLLGVFCRRLDSIASGELKRSVPEFLADFEASVVSGALRPAMATLPLDRSAQLDVVMRMAGMLLRRSNVHPRFVECIHAFTNGIGNGPGATLESLAQHYADAHDRFYDPFMQRHPWILENYLINTIFRCRFPFGKVGDTVAVPGSIAIEYALLTAQFALTKGFLIGVAGHHRSAYSAEHVVYTVQATSKHFEHHPEFLGLAHQLLVESHMDGARGLAILLRNADTPQPQPTAPEIQPPVPQFLAKS